MVCIAVTTALLITSIIAALAGAGAGIYSTAKNVQSQKETNEANKQMQEATNSANIALARETNATQMDLAKHAHQYEMADLKAAGLNPILTATGGQGMAVPNLYAPQTNTPRNIAPMYDTSGITNAMNAMSHMMAMSVIADQRNETSIANNTARNQVLNGLYRRKAESLGSSPAAAGAVNSAKQMSTAKQKLTDISEKDWQKMWKSLGRDELKDYYKKNPKVKRYYKV